jgi:hypothetical protein
MAENPESTHEGGDVNKRTLTTTDEGAPIIYFDEAPTFASFNNIIAVTLSAARYTPGPEKPKVDLVVTAHLRCNLQAALSLRKAIDDALLLATPAGDRRPGSSH